MSKRLPNPRRAKIHRNYTVIEVASLCAVHRGTVREWIKQGLPTCDKVRPLLILGADLKAFLERKRTKDKQHCQPGEIYCVRCRAPKTPALHMADYQPLTVSGGNLIGLCPTCSGLIYRRVNLSRLEQVRGLLDITLPEALRHISESRKPSVNSDLETGA